MIKYKILYKKDGAHMLFNAKNAEIQLKNTNLAIETDKPTNITEYLDSDYHIIHQFDLLFDYIPILMQAIKDNNLDVDYCILNTDGTYTNLASLVVKYAQEDTVDLLDLFDLLIEQKISIENIFLDNQNIIEAIISRASIFLLEKLISKEYYHDTILSLMNIEDNLEVYFHAAFKGYRSICQFFIKHGIDVNICTMQGAIALHYAAYNGHDELCKELVELGADINSIDHHSTTPLHYAVKNAHLKTCITLKKLGANLQVQDQYGATVIHLASYEDNDQYIEIFDMLACKENIDIKDDLGETALHYAADKGNIQICKKLIEFGANVHIRDKNLATPLHYAADKGNIEICNKLIEFGADMDMRDKNLATPLHYAARNGIIGIYELLGNHLKEQQYFDRPDNNQFTPLCYAIQGYYLALNNNIDTNKECYYNIIQCLVEAGAQINTYIFSTKSLLSYASIYCDYDLLSMILNKSQDINTKIQIEAARQSIKYGKIKNAILLFDGLNAQEQNGIVIDSIKKMYLSEQNIPNLLHILINLKNINQPNSKNILITSLISKNFYKTNEDRLLCKANINDFIEDIDNMLLDDDIEVRIDNIGNMHDDMIHNI